MLRSMAWLWSQCPGWWPVPRLWFMVGWGLWAQPAAIILQTRIWGSPCTGLVGGAEWSIHGDCWWELELDPGVWLQEELRLPASPRLGSGH